MSKNKKIVWSITSIVVLAALLNAITITSAYIYGPGFFWILLITIPILVIGVYNAVQTNHILIKYLNSSLQPYVKETKFEFLSHSIYPYKIEETDLKVLIGNDQCSQPYNACIVNIASMMKTKTKRHQSIDEEKLEHSKYSVDEGLNTYHLAAGGLAWQIGPDYTGCRAQNDNFNSNAFKKNARKPEVKMIELKLSSAIKPFYPIDSPLDTIQPIERRLDNSIFPGAGYTTFREAEGMIYFLHSLRELSGGKPIGIRLCINDKKEFYQICHAVRKTQIVPDFIVVEGSFENTGIFHTDQVFHGIPLYEALIFVSQTLQVYALEKEIKIIASGRISSCFDILKVLALGANAVCTDMPGYIPVKYPGDERKAASRYKDQKVHDFHSNLLKATVHSMKVCGFMSVNDITLSKFFRRLDVLHSKNFEELNGPILYPRTAKKIYNSKIRSYQPHKDIRKESIVSKGIA